jgi:hypothetical protein
MRVVRRGRWRFRDVNVTLPVALVRSMFERARHYGRAEGGRFDGRLSTVVLWSGPPCALSARPIGQFCVRWGSPTSNKATIHRIGWDDTHDGALGEVCHAVEILAGQLVTR